MVALDVDLKRPGEVVGLCGQHRSRLVHRRIRDHDLDLAEQARRLRSEGPGRVRIPEVERHHMRHTPGCSDLGRRGFHLLEPPRAEDNGVTIGGECTGHRLADA